MLGRLGIWRHVVVGACILGCVVLALIGVLGGRGEQFDAKQITVSPAGGDGVRVREVADQDFGNHQRHGYERVIPNDFGVPTDIVASSPDANADIGVTYNVEGNKTRIRLGDPNEQLSGQHRYILEYTLPDARVSSGTLALDIVAPDEKLETKRFDVIVTGFVLNDPQCAVGDEGAEGGCTLERVGDDYRVIFQPLAAGDGVTIGGTIASIVDPTIPDLPALPATAADHRVQVALAMIPVGLLGAVGVFIWARRKGRNEVFSGGAVEAAYGTLPSPALAGTAPTVSTRLVPDSKMEEMATIEFVPPKGIEPWQGAVLLTERINESTTAAWFSGLAAKDAITLRHEDGSLIVGEGPKRNQLDRDEAAIVNSFLHDRDELTLGKYDAKFAGAWSAVHQQQTAMIRSSGWWKSRPPGGSPFGCAAALIWVAAVAGVFVIGGFVLSATIGVASSIPLAIAVGFVVPALAAVIVYSTMLPARSATGSALALLTESFRRFLVASEGQHVEWAWKQGLLREYSAWAVALGAADAWNNALEHSNVPPAEYINSSPLLVYSMASSFSHSHTAPSSSGTGGGGGGFSGGSVGGGGGGGSSGSW